MTDDIKDDNPVANKVGEQKLKTQFELQNEFADDYAKLSPEGQKEFKKFAEVGALRIDQQLKDQKKYRTFRQIKEENKLLRKYISDPAPRPQGAKNIEQDLQIIEEQASRNVAQREANYIDMERKNAHKSLKYVIRQDKMMQRGDLQRDFQQEQER